MAREFPLREKPFRELLIKKSHQIPQLLSLSQGEMDALQAVLI